MSVLTLSSDMIAQVCKAATQIGERPEALVERAVRQFLRAEAQRQIHREAVVFRAQHAELLAQYPGQYVAIYQGGVIGHDSDQLALLARVEEQYPDAPVLIAPVLATPEETYTMRSPHWESGL